MMFGQEVLSSIPTSVAGSILGTKAMGMWVSLEAVAVALAEAEAEVLVLLAMLVAASLGTMVLVSAAVVIAELLFSTCQGERGAAISARGTAKTVHSPSTSRLPFWF